MKLNPWFLTYQNWNCVVNAHDLCILLLLWIWSLLLPLLSLVTLTLSQFLDQRELLFTYSLATPVEIIICTLMIIGSNIFFECVCYVDFGCSVLFLFIFFHLENISKTKRNEYDVCITLTKYHMPHCVHWFRPIAEQKETKWNKN